jgi:hypothetical protein
VDGGHDRRHPPASEDARSVAHVALDDLGRGVAEVACSGRVCVSTRTSTPRAASRPRTSVPRRPVPPATTVILEPSGRSPRHRRSRCRDRQARGRTESSARDAGHLRAGITLARAADVLWTCGSPELYELLVLRHGWTPRRSGRFVANALIDALL